MDADDVEAELKKAMAQAEAAIDKSNEAIENRTQNTDGPWRQTNLTIKVSHDNETAEEAQKRVDQMIQIVREEERATWADEQKRLQLSLTEAQAAADFSKDKLLRSMAEFENYKRRAVSDVEQRIHSALGRLLEDFLPIGDNLARAKSVAQANEKILEGIAMVEQSFFGALAKHDIAPVLALGCSFNPEVHEAIAQQPNAAERGMIVEEFEKGYTWRDKLLRPARVVVSMGKPETE